MTQTLLYRVTFLHQGELYEVYAEGAGQSDLFGFVEVEGLVFGERSQVVVDPSEERIKNEFKNVTRFHLPLHSVLRIDEVEKAGVSRISAADSGGTNISLFPGGPPLSMPGDGKNDS